MNVMKPKHYKILLEPDLKNFLFKGRADIRMKLLRPVAEITLNLLELAVWSCQLRVGERLVDCPFQVNPENETLTVTLPEETEGEILMSVLYVGQINDRMVGFYRSAYKVAGQSKYIAVTQFEESDARRAFPCYDHPAMKATFEVEMTLDRGLTALSNSPVMEEQEVGEGKKVVRFQKTPRMSPYLLFFGMGEFEFIEDHGEVLVRTAAMPGMTKYAAYGMDFGRKSLEFCEEYYGIKYPLPKLDLIAIPDFAFGAMENWGAITFRENLLLHYPGVTSKAGEQRICEVIAHEMVHQWFGNLVTPSDWKYLWLNESFATYFGFSVVDHYHPQWGVWQQFLHSQTDTALARDALVETFPIEIPGGEHVVINSSTAPIIYNKGGSVLRQIEGYIGSERFKEGLRHYLRQHAYDCASSHHLWEALEEVSEKPVSRIMKNWVEQPGFPQVEVSREGKDLVLTQSRFTYLSEPSDQTWLIPITVRIYQEDGDSKIFSVLLSEKEGRIPIGEEAAAYKLNPGQTGFYRVRYRAREDLDRIGHLIHEKRLSPEDRWGVQNDLYAQVRSGEATLDEYVAFLSHYEGESDFLPVISITDNLFHAYMIAEGEKRDEISLAGLSFIETVLKKIGYEPGDKEGHTTSIVREKILFHAVLYGSREAQAFSLHQFGRLMREETVHPDLMKCAMEAGALTGAVEAFVWFDKRLQSTESEHERINILNAMGCFADPDRIADAQEYALKKVPSRNQFVLIGALASNPHGVPLMWDWYVSRTAELEKMHPIHYERVIAAIVPVCGLGREEEVKSFFEEYVHQKETARDVIKLSLERLEINGRMRKGLVT